MTDATVDTPVDPRPKDPVASIAGQVAHLSTGDRARLRRLYLTRSHEADGVVVGLLHRAGVAVSAREEVFAPWRLLAHVAALLAGTAAAQPHALGRRLGTALHASGLSENRLLRLTAARGPALHAQIVRAARLLAQAGEAPVNLWTLHHLAGRDPDLAEAARIRIAQDYYAAAARA
ncbi:type I-E CRISPR-associated protein Cse2/CasB [Sphingomonas sp.]|uniref:type I-E CRISPR-associated protein Cse2/CasB n=1 Tax=Sphingomonas sp. TaxID=28214 RepID=UPI0035C7FB33